MRILVHGFLHHKNKESLNLINNYIPVIILNDLNNIQNYDDGETILICGDYISKINFSKVIYGPNIDLYNIYKHCKNNPQETININMLSQWVKKIIQKLAPESKANFICLPFPVNVDKYKPDIKQNKIFIYYKHVEYYKLQLALNLIKDLNIEYKIFQYGNYKSDDYLNYIKSCKYGIWVGSHESQGFAFQEALSCNCPLFVLDVNSLKDEFYSYNDFPWRRSELAFDNLEATSASYWSDECGIVCKNLDFNNLREKFNEFLEKLNSYNGRKFILENLTVKQFINNLKTLI